MKVKAKLNGDFVCRPDDNELKVVQAIANWNKTGTDAAFADLVKSAIGSIGIPAILAGEIDIEGVR